MENTMNTSFISIFDRFLSRVTDEMYMELSELDTLEMLQELLLNGIHAFEFPRVNLLDYEEGYLDSLGTYTGVESDGIEVPATGWVGGTFNVSLTTEEQNILAINMVVEWLNQQLEITENTQMKYSGSDFKFSSQANHMAKLKVLIEAKQTESFHMQRLYKRRKRNDEGIMESTMGQIMEVPNYGYNI